MHKQLVNAAPVQFQVGVYSNSIEIRGDNVNDDAIDDEYEIFLFDWRYRLIFATFAS
ncbi:hypothetical protein Tsp_11615 [Trichinella spiralis]|uniref:hypothetical protein n=1 Tax=Trichinella spiralis TaxID=6334 RepID=UPI0001EFE8DA|nr:hypothetical protein Tsp_11615 [Trichinella spiralis]